MATFDRAHPADGFHLSRKASDRIRWWCWFVLLGVLAVPFVYPFIWMVASAFKPLSEIFGTARILPQDPRLMNFVEVFTYQPFARHYFNSLYISTSVTALTLVFASLAGYALARIRFAGSGLMLLLLISALMVPEEVTIIPNFFLVGHLGLMDTHWPLILLTVFGSHGVLATFLMRQFFSSLPKELEEAGTMDGLTRLGVWWRVALPSSRPALGAVAILTFLHSWNLFLEPLVFISSLELFTLPVSLANFTDDYGAPLWNLQLAATTLAVVPVLVVYIIAQRQIIESFALSGVKG